MNEALLIAAGIIGLYFYKQKEAAGNLIFFPGMITNMYWDNATPVAELTLQIQNTSNVDIDINSMAGTVFANGVRVGNVSNFSPVRIGRNSETLLPIKVRFDLIGLVNDVIRAWQGGAFKQDVRIEGYVNAGSVQVPISLVFKVS